MPLSSEEYRRVWEHADLRAPYLNHKLASGTCVLETISMVVNPDERYVFLADFGHAVSYCRQRVWEDLVPPEKRGSDEGPDRWRRMRAAFSLKYLEVSWARADAAFAELLDTYVSDGYARALGDRLREIVNTYGFDLELGDIYALPRDLPALLSMMGADRRSFNFTDGRQRATLARRLRAVNKTA